jgi:hypothetical protein
MCRVTALAVSLLSLLAGSTARAQDPPASAPASQQPAILQRINVDRGGGFHLTRSFAVVFGGIKQGSGPAAGPAISHDFADGSYAQLKAVYSLRHFKLLQARFDSRPFFGKRLTASTRARWQDAPELSLYGLGADSPDLRAEFSERRIEWSGVVRLSIAPKTMVLGGTGIERYATDGGWIDTGEDEAPDFIPRTPGLGTRPWFVHSFVEAVHDTRLSPEFSRTGRLLDASFHSYYDAHDGAQSFQRVTLAAYQLVPIPNERGAIGAGAQAWLSATGQGHDVPFFLMPTLGGGNYLRGYSSYRFRDRNALLLQAEYRYPVHRMIDVAGFYEAGTVSPTVRGLGRSRMAQDVGIGVRAHTKTSGLLRADLAHGSEGFKIAFGVGIGGGS